MSDPLSSDTVVPIVAPDISASRVASEVFRRRLAQSSRTQSLIINPSASPPPPPPPEYAPPSPPRGRELAFASKDGGRTVTSQLVPAVGGSIGGFPGPKSFAAAAAAVEQQLLLKNQEASPPMPGANGLGGGRNGSLTKPIRRSVGYKPILRNPSSDSGGKTI